ncbi:MAG: hypothetical protein ACREV5_22875 [Steroidobacter sp.]
MRAARLIACTLLASGCASIAKPDTPAVIVDPTADSRIELHRVVTDALHRNDVTLAGDALTRESLLIIERTPARDSTGQRLSGREFGKPEQFQLVMSGARCMLIHQSSGRRYELTQTRCKGV